jgi:putative transposase
MCRVLDVSPSGYYAWAKRPVSGRTERDAALTEQIRAAHAASKGTYGAPRLQVDLADAGIRVGRKRVARLMRNAGLAGVTRRRSTVTTVRDGARRAPDLVNREFTADRPDMLWVADITYIPTWAGFLYLAVVLDAFSRRIVGWSMASTLHRQVVLDALDMALWQRQPSGVIHHSDQGSQYTSIEFGKRCREAGVRPSMGSVGDAYDNAMAESFFATLECELLDRRRFKTQAEARIATFEFIEGFYNPRRRHSSLGYQSPVEFECQFAETILAPGAHQHAAVLAPVKQRPGDVVVSRTAGAPAVLDRRSTRQPGQCAGRNEKAAEPKMASKRRTECPQPRYPLPKTSPLHKTGASPSCLAGQPWGGAFLSQEELLERPDRVLPRRGSR